MTPQSRSTTLTLPTSPTAPMMVVLPPAEPVQPPNGHLRAENVLGLPIRPKSAGQWSVIVMVNPAVARWLIQVQTKRQRPITKSKLNNFILLMKESKFVLTHQGLGVDWDGLTIDGQHRLLALIEADITLPFWITFNLDPDTFMAIDRGGLRTSTDDLMILGLTGDRRAVAKAAQGAARLILNYEAGRLPWQDIRPPTTTELVEIMGAHPQLELAARVAADGHRVVPPSAFAAFYCLMRESNAPMADRFATKLISGEDIGAGDPLRPLRDFLVLHHGDKRGRYRQEIMTRLVRAWNATRQGRSIKTLQGKVKPGKPFPRVL